MCATAQVREREEPHVEMLQLLGENWDLQQELSGSCARRGRTFWKEGTGSQCA